MTVPATAVLTSSSGSTCVYPDVDVEPVAVRPVGGGVGTVHLPLDTPLDTVLANPIDVLESPTCG